MGCVLLSSAQLRQPLFWSDFDCGHSPSVEGILNPMKRDVLGRSQSLSFCSAIVMGLGVSTGHPLGIIAAAGMPLACLTPGTRKAAFKSTLGYYGAAIWPMVPGLDRYTGQSTTLLIPLAIWVFAAILLSVPWTIAWTSDRRVDCIWRAPLALLATIVPPLGIIGLASPLTAAGYLFPGTGWVGLAAVALLPGIILSTQALGLRRRCACYLCLVSALPWARHRRSFLHSRRCRASSWMDCGKYSLRRCLPAFPGLPRGSIYPAESGRDFGASPHLSRVRCSPVVGSNGSVLATIARSLPNARPNTRHRSGATGQAGAARDERRRLSDLRVIRLRCRDRRSEGHGCASTPY